MPRLLQRSRRPDAVRSAAADDVPLELPPYEPPSYPMDDKIKHALAAMYNSETDSSKRQYEKHLQKSTEFLNGSVGSMNDILFHRKQSLARMAEKRRTRGKEEREEREVSLGEYVAELDAAITELTDSSEEALRWIIDCRAELKHHQAVLDKVMEGLNAQQPPPEPREPKKGRSSKRRKADNDDEDGDGEAQEEDDGENAEAEEAQESAAPLVGVKELLEAARKAKVDEYEATSAYERYAVHNDYISFKRNLHDALHPEDQVPLPDASTWFDEHGRPVKDPVAIGNEDDDLVVEREIIDLKCPLSLQNMKEPYSNHKCKHTFEKAAIIEFIQSNGGLAKCPVCSKDLRVRDLFLDELILRKITRAEQARRREVDDTSDIEPEEDDDSSMVVGKATYIKKEKERLRRRMVEIDQDDD